MKNERKNRLLLEWWEGFRARLGLAPGQDLLEVGCGTGQITGWLVNTVAPGRVIAVDFSPAMLAAARRRNPSADLRLVDICSGEPLRDRFDVILCFSAFPHFRQKSTALRQMAHSLKPDGRLFILHLAGSAAINDFHQKLSAPVCRDLLPAPDKWPDLLEASGLRLSSLVDQPDLFLLKAVPASS